MKKVIGYWLLVIGLLAGVPCELSAQELTAADALYLIEMALDVHPSGPDDVRWHKQEARIRSIIAQTRDPYGLKDMSVHELKQLSDGLELAIAHCKDRDDLNTLVRFYEAVLNKARQRSGESITAATANYGKSQ